jgi:AbrB family looped-hinge helix DNA binding protein
VPLSLQQVSPIDSDRHGADQHLTLAGPGHRRGREAEHLWPARGRDSDGAHGFWCGRHGKTSINWLDGTEKTAKISAKGQITVPNEVRRALGVGAGDRLGFEEVDGEIRMVPLRAGTPFAR